ncbi:MAG TPA: DUF1553 domain-containing protein [Lacipirellulaceae bacterium]|jgi:hypothetical protein|nr:DUF1553 domain-containing protein [Lacipirellulaceae bacterium]
MIVRLPLLSTRIELVAVAVISLIAARACEAVTQPPVSYGRDIGPILSDKCFRCHGPDAETRQADLRLDAREGITSKVVVPGKPDESEIVKRVFSNDDNERMPPPDSKLSLSAEQKELLRRWIAEGTAFTEHWSFQPLPEKIDVPYVKDASWPRQPLDNFVLAHLESEKLHPAPAAAPLRLLRRVTLDLTGLPPTPEECLKFERTPGKSFDASYTAIIDRLLASPAFGEHMAVDWLDAARYADSYGYQSDQLNTQWPYRDWVVRALNDNLPYDEFLKYQLAGDLLPNASRDQVLATAFNRLHRLTNEGGTIAEEARVDGVFDRVNTFGTAILGLTVECSRCHDHKYDPITMRDYYSLSSFFNSIDENGMYDHAAKVPAPSLLLPTEEQAARLAAASEKVAHAKSECVKTIEAGDQRFNDWLATAKPATNTDFVAYFSFDGDLAKLNNQAAGGKGEGNADSLQHVPGVHGQAIHFDGDSGATFPGLLQVDRWNSFTIDFWMRDNATNDNPVVVLQRTFGTDVGYNGFDLMLHSGILEARFYRIWPGNGIGVKSRTPIAGKKWQHIAVNYDGSSTAAGLKLFLDGTEMPTEILRDHIYKKASLPTFGSGALTLGERFRDRGFKDGEIDELRLFDRNLTTLEVSNLHDGVAKKNALADPQSHREALATYYFSAIDPDARKAANALRDARRALVELEEPLQEVPVMQEMATARQTYILPRGAYDAPKSDANRVDRNTFAKILIPFPRQAPRNRLGLAQWLTDPRHPLTARVFVNRVWANFFGRGLVTTPENFGQQGALPTHPELLDWLARDFVDHGWDIKRLCRMIVTSATYQQDSRADRDLRARDPENLLLARGPSHRLSAEEIRDVALAAADLLDRRLGGPPVSPYQPGEDLWREANTMSPAYHQSIGKDLYRRSLYSVWKRTAPLPNMAAFDAPTREVCTVSRGRTNTPMQALVLLNDVQFVEAARALAAVVSRDHTDLPSQIDEAFLRFTGRHPDATELALLTDLDGEQSKAFAETPSKDVSQFLNLGDSKSTGKLTPADLAALTAVCQTILNLDATIVER